MRYNQKERLGVIQSDLIFTREIGWVFREQPIVDVGIDALIEKSENGDPKGKFLAAQIKSGLGNFYEKEAFLTYYISKVHYHYWINLDLPIIIIAHIEEENYTSWECISEHTMEKSRKGWKIEIPKSKVLCKESKVELEELLSKVSHHDNFINKIVNGEISKEEFQKILSCSKIIKKSENAIYRMIEIMNETSKGLKENTAKINFYVKKGINHKSRKGKKLINELSFLINKSANELDVEIENFAKYFSEGFRAYEKLSYIYYEISKDKESLDIVYQTLVKLEAGINEALEGIKFMKSKASTLPEDIAKIKKAKFKFVNSSQNIINEHKEARKLCKKLSNSLYEKIE